MAEAIAALALAGNIFQFLEAGGKFSKKAYAIATTGSNSLADLRELRHITEYLHPLLEQLTQGTDLETPRAINRSQARLIALSKECSQVVKELLQTLDDAGVADSGRQMNAIITAFKLTWRQSKIQQLDHQISKLRQQLAVDLLISIREHSCKALEQQEEILEHLRKDSAKNQSAARTNTSREQGMGPANDTLGMAVLEYLESRTESASIKTEVQEIGNTIEHILFHEHSYQDYSSVYGQNYPKIEMKPMKREDVQSQIISSLRYQEIYNRKSNIAKAHENTLQWLFKDNTPDRKDANFRQWLESNQRLYWITGKAGSGKSTLMKYITKSDGIVEGGSKCDAYLEKWAGSKDNLVVASFYFWASGTSMEASQRGLFQSLLFQLLTKRPDLIPRVAPRVWEAWCLFGWQASAYMENDLHLMFYNSVKVLVEEDKAKVCLFIDGLDEYNGDHHKLISTCQALFQLQNVKMCLSSRPWIVFEDAFSQAPNLMLQDFTYFDIKSFVVSKFSENEGFKRLQLREGTYAEGLLENITEKSSGVFLWVHLVVKSLLAGLSYDDRLSDLQRRLNLLPPDLEKLYVAILEDLDPFYFEHSSQYFMLLQASEDPPEALMFSLADEEDPSFALTLSTGPFSNQERDIRVDALRRRLNSRCKGLLELGAQNRVHYLHRSVRDYINSHEVNERIQSATGKNFDCYLRICAASLAMVKKLSTASSLYESRHSYARQCLKAAAQVKHDTSLMIRILDCLDQTLRETEPPKLRNIFYQTVPVKEYVIIPWNSHHLGTSFIATAVRLGVVDYVHARTEAGCLSMDDNTYHDDTIRYPVEKENPNGLSRFQRFMQNMSPLGVPTKRNTSGDSRRKGTWPLLLDAVSCIPPSLPMFRCLLECGANPNLVFDCDGRTPWTETIARMLTDHIFSRRRTASSWAEWAPILQLLLEYGAPIDQRLCGLVCQKMRQPALYYLTAERLVVVLHCLATGREELGLEYLSGQNNVSVFKKQNRRLYLKIGS
ncbi:hypothetical protein E0Z10_g5922 [Xylaria hypoxylon]|uniref:NACHT domain-containing protein n=1 Tax=Xylaria hypoxylon TaxID=37992 RepID=A0A4Z0YTV5_9PEZI|nr:hypothetical protein E0Z10_g5922 [Xylaria hypoxylon]